MYINPSQRTPYMDKPTCSFFINVMLVSVNPPEPGESDMREPSLALTLCQSAGHSVIQMLCMMGKCWASVRLQTGFNCIRMFHFWKRQIVATHKTYNFMWSVSAIACIKRTGQTFSDISHRFSEVFEASFSSHCTAPQVRTEPSWNMAPLVVPFSLC